MFIDWLTVRQRFDSIPVFADSLHQRVNHEDGELQWSNYVGCQHQGSHSSSIRIRSDGRTLEMSGNPSKWNRQDNLFGVCSVSDALLVFNKVLSDLGLPAFFDDENTYLAPRQYQKGSGVVREGLVITRVDLTKNYDSGGPQNSERVLHSLRSMRHRNRPPTDYGSSLVFGLGSRHASFKYYLKSVELKNHNPNPSGYLQKVIEHCESKGIVRFEVSLKSKYLKAHGLDKVGAWTVGRMESILSDYGLHLRVSTGIGSFMEIRDVLVEQGIGKLRAERCQQAALAFIGGHNLRSGMSSSAFYRLRSDLLLVGIDINAELNISALRFTVSTIELSPSIAPSWYQVPGAKLSSVCDGS